MSDAMPSGMLLRLRLRQSAVLSPNIVATEQRVGGELTARTDDRLSATKHAVHTYTTHRHRGHFVASQHHRVTFRRYRLQAISPIAINVTIPWSAVCHVRGLCSSGRRYRNNFFAYDSTISLPDRIKNWLTSLNAFLPKFYPKVTHPMLI